MQRLLNLIERANCVTNPLLPNAQRLEATVTHTESLYDLECGHPHEIREVLHEFAQQAQRFMSVATDPSEDIWLRTYILNFTLKLGFTHIAKASQRQDLPADLSQGRAAFSSATVPIASLASGAIDLQSIMQSLLEICGDGHEEAGIRGYAAELYVLASGYANNGFRFELDAQELLAALANRHGDSAPDATPGGTA